MPARTMLQSLSTHLNHPSKDLESVIDTRRRRFSHWLIIAEPSSLVKVCALVGCWMSDIHDVKNGLVVETKIFKP